MNTNILAEPASASAVSPEPRGVIAALVATAMLAFRSYLKRKAAARPELMSRADFYAELAALKDQMHANQLAVLEKLDANQRELLAALDRQAARINAVESGLARVDERTS
jgi:hypothetical protein